MKKIIALALFLFVVSTGLAQENPFRVGVKLGVPNIAGFNAEYVTPARRLAATGDFSFIRIGFGNTDVRLRYLEAGANYYFFKDGRGLYGHASYGHIKAGIDYKNVQSESDPDKYGEGSASIGVDLINLKLGAKLGRGFYFRPELGFAFASVGDTVNVLITYPDGTTEDRSRAIPGYAGGGLLLNLGFGFSF